MKFCWHHGNWRCRGNTMDVYVGNNPENERYPFKWFTKYHVTGHYEKGGNYVEHKTHAGVSATFDNAKKAASKHLKD